MARVRVIPDPQRPRQLARLPVLHVQHRRRDQHRRGRAIAARRVRPRRERRCRVPRHHPGAHRQAALPHHHRDPVGHRVRVQMREVLLVGRIPVVAHRLEDRLAPRHVQRVRRLLRDPLPVRSHLRRPHCERRVVHQHRRRFRPAPAALLRPQRRCRPLLRPDPLVLRTVVAPARQRPIRVRHHHRRRPAHVHLASRPHPERTRELRARLHPPGPPRRVEGHRRLLGLGGRRCPRGWGHRAIGGRGRRWRRARSRSGRGRAIQLARVPDRALRLRRRSRRR